MFNKEKRYHIALNEYEHSFLVRALNDEKTKLKEEGKHTDLADDLLLKVLDAPLKKFRFIEREELNEER